MLKPHCLTLKTFEFSFFKRIYKTLPFTINFNSIQKKNRNREEGQEIENRYKYSVYYSSYTDIYFEHQWLKCTN